MTLRNEQIAAISVFGAYKVNDRDAYDVIADFTKAAIVIKKEVEFTPEIIQDHLRELYSLEIPISIIKGVVKNRLKEFVTKTNGAYIVNELPDDNISSQIDELLESYNIILTGLKEFLAQKLFSKTSRKYDEEYIVSQFAKFIIDDYADEILSPYFSAYIISQKDQNDFKSYFERFAIGLISYYGLQYFGNTNNVGSWPKDCKLTIFLDTEFLFDCADYNDSYYKKIYDEFKSLVDEINKPYVDKPVIELKYFSETNFSFDQVFNRAKSCIKNRQAPDPSKEALMKIVRESSDEFDVETHKATVAAEIKGQKIVYDSNDYSSFLTDERFIIFSKEEYENYIVEYSKQSLENAPQKFDYYTKVLTFINGLRGGVSKTSFDNCRYIFLSNSRIGHRLSYDQAKRNNNAVPLATDIDWLVSRFWYKLNKSFASKKIPLSLDIVARSQASLSEDVCALIKTRFDVIKKRNLPDKVKQELYAGIRTIPKEIELYDASSLPEILDFISYDSTEAFITAQYKMKESASRSEENALLAKQKEEELMTEREEKKSAQKEAYSYKKQLRHQQNLSVVPKIKCRYILFHFLYWFICVAIIIGVLFIEWKAICCKTESVWAWIIPAFADLIAIGSFFIFAHKHTYKKIGKKEIIRNAIQSLRR